MLLGAEIASEYPRVMRGDYDHEDAKADSEPLRTKVWNLLVGLVFHEDERTRDAGRDEDS